MTVATDLVSDLAVSDPITLLQTVKDLEPHTVADLFECLDAVYTPFQWSVGYPVIVTQAGQWVVTARVYLDVRGLHFKEGTGVALSLPEATERAVCASLQMFGVHIEASTHDIESQTPVFEEHTDRTRPEITLQGDPTSDLMMLSEALADVLEGRVASCQHGLLGIKLGTSKKPGKNQGRPYGRWECPHGDTCGTWVDQSCLEQAQRIIDARGD